MSLEKVTQALNQLQQTAPYKILNDFFDEGSFCEVDALVKSDSDFAEAVAGFGTVEGLPVYAFAQNSDICGGAMSKAQAKKITKIYDMALKTGAPVVGFYDSVGGKLTQGNEMLSAFGEVLSASSKISGVVPQVSVVLGTCLGTGALTAVNADFVIMSKKASLSLDTTGEKACAEYNAEKGIASVICDDSQQAIEKAKELVTYLPSNNLNTAPAAFEQAPEEGDSDCFAKLVADAQSIYKLSSDFGKAACTSLARIDGQVVGFVGTKGEVLDCKAANKVARLVRFCDAFSIPVITFVNGKGFSSIKSAKAVTCAYAEATTVKISVVTGEAYGAFYLALAGTGANTDITFALPQATISPIAPKAAAFIMAPDEMNVPVDKQDEAAKKFAQENLSAFSAAQNGFIDDVATKEQLRAKLTSALDMLSGKRVPTLAKKHSTV